MAAPIQNQGQQQGQTGQMGQTPGTQQQPGQGVPKSQQGTGYTNLNTIMAANQGNQLGQAVAGGVENTGQQATNALNQGVQTFNQNAAQNALGTQAQQQYVQNTLGNLGIGANGQSTNPTSVTGPSSTDVSNFQQYMAGQYGGPTNIANIGSIQNQASNAQAQGQELGTSGGRQALLQQYAANPGSAYGQGAQALDTVLLGATGGNQLNQARQAVSGLNNQVNSAQSAAQQQAQQLQNQAAGFGQAVTGQVQGAQSNIYNPAVQAAQAANIANTQGQAAEAVNAQNIGSGQFTQADLTGLGLTAGQNIYGSAGNIAQNAIAYTPQNEQATALNQMSNPQYQQYSGLNTLMGKTTGVQGNPYQAGQTTFNQAAAQGDIATNAAPVTAAQTAANNAYQQYAAAEAAYNAVPTNDPYGRDIMQGAQQNAYNQYQNAQNAIVI